MSVLELCTVLSNNRLTDSLYSLTLQGAKIAALANPGQFIHIKCGDGNFLRRPISICDVEGDMLRIIFEIKGAGTKWLSKQGPKHTLDVLGPCGHGFSIGDAGDSPVFIGGGIGVPPMLYAMKAAKNNGAKPEAILGFRNKSAVILENEFQELGTVHLATDDGSYGEKGFVSGILRKQPSSYSAVYCCGPRGMLRALAQICEENKLFCEVSMEERMGCGIGACLVCAIKTKTDASEPAFKHVCKDGPVFRSSEVVWE